ncbi:MAG: hypothetical protein ACPGQO_05870 [Candidatus Poseidoniaceae archaeon]
MRSPPDDAAVQHLRFVQMDSAVRDDVHHDHLDHLDPARCFLVLCP